MPRFLYICRVIKFNRMSSLQKEVDALLKHYESKDDLLMSLYKEKKMAQFTITKIYQLFVQTLQESDVENLSLNAKQRELFEQIEKHIVTWKHE